MMKRKLGFLWVAILFSAINIVAAEKADKVLWGVKASFDAELPGKWHGGYKEVFKMFTPGCGVTLGAVCNVYLGKNFYFEPGVSLVYSQYRYKDLAVMGVNGHIVSTNPKLGKWSVQVPLAVGYTIDFSERFVMNVFTGPQIRYAFAGGIKSGDGLEDKVEFESWDINGQRRFGLAWKIGIGFPISDFMLSFDADLGITNLLKENVTFRENRLSLGLTYYF